MRISKIVLLQTELLSNTRKIRFRQIWRVVRRYSYIYYIYKQSKAVPLHAMVALVGREVITPTHSWPRH
jgi:hypothetical protein